MATRLAEQLALLAFGLEIADFTLEATAPSTLRRSGSTPHLLAGGSACPHASRAAASAVLSQLVAQSLREVVLMCGVASAAGRGPPLSSRSRAWSQSAGFIVARPTAEGVTCDRFMSGLPDPSVPNRKPDGPDPVVRALPQSR